MRKGFKKALSFVLSAAMLLSMGSGFTFSPASAAETKNDTGVAGGGFKAMVAYQTSSYDCRDGFNTVNYQGALDSLYNEWAKQNGKEVTDNYNGYNLYLNGNVPSVDRQNQLKKPEKVEVCTGASVTDVKMSGDGEYTVSIKNLDLRKKAGTVQYFNNLFVSTNIPILSKDDPNANVKVEASSVKVGGNECLDGVTVLPLKADAAKNIGTYSFMVADGYAPGDGTKNCKFPKANPAKKDADGKELGAATDVQVPDGVFDIEITFKITGVDWKTAPQEDTFPTLKPPATAAPVQTVEPVTSVDLKNPFDIYISANVNEALTPDKGDGIRLGSDNKAIQAASFGSEALKTKVLAAKNAKGTALFDTATQDYITSDESCLTITKTGVYELSVTARENSTDFGQSGAVWLPILMNGSVGNMPEDFNVKANSITVTNASGSKTYSWTSQVMKDGQGDVRVSVCNQWAGEAEKAAANTITEAIPVTKGDKITFKFAVVLGAPTSTVATPEAIGASTSYMSYLGFQTDDWMFRDNWQADTGLKCKDYDYKKQVAWSHEGKTNAVDVTSITDAKMTKNDVKYTVAINGINVKKTSKDSKQFNMLYLSTDIPLSMKGVTVKNAVLKIDGKTIKNYKVVPNKGDASKYYQFMLADAYAPNDGTKDAPYPSGKTLKTLPTKSIEVEYTISGVDFNSRVVSVGNFKYKLSGKKAQVVGLSKKGKKKANLSLGKTIKVKAASPSAITSAPAVQTYKITSVKAGAFKKSAKLKKFSFKKATNIKALPAKAFMNCKKLKTVELNKKMKKIPAQAFKGCKNLSTIKCNAKLKSVSKSAFKGCKKKIKITGKSKKANKKKIKKAYKKVK